MSFDVKTVSVLSGLTVFQLKNWASQGVFEPENGDYGYSFRDIVAARMLAFLRTTLSAQKVKEAVRSLSKLNFNDHLSTYTLGHDGKIVLLKDKDGQIIEIGKTAGQYRAFTLQEIWKPFKNFKNEQVPSLERPREELRIVEGRLGGWPTVGESRIGFDVIANMIDGKSITPENISHFYPGVTPKAARDALDFMQAVQAA